MAGLVIVALCLLSSATAELPAPGLRGAFQNQSAYEALTADDAADDFFAEVLLTSEASAGNCQKYGCGLYIVGRTCQCNPGCDVIHSCCPDYASICTRSHPSTKSPGSGPPVSKAPLFTFYMYRAQSNVEYTLGNHNAANLAGVMWYLQHEVVITDPPKFGISRILRYRVRARAPTRLYDEGMNFGVRFAYDSQKCTGPGDCSEYETFGNFIGCNKLGKYPYPQFETKYTNGVWYSLPAEGACEGEPTGSDNCTYSFEPAGEITLKSLQGPEGKRFWDWGDKVMYNDMKVRRAQMRFQLRYPATSMPHTLKEKEPPCDFDISKFPQQLNFSLR